MSTPIIGYDIPERPARPGELCTCGRQARVVYPSERWPGGECGACLVDGSGSDPILPCPWCGTHTAHCHSYGDVKPCPQYQLRPPGAHDEHVESGVRLSRNAGHDVGREVRPYGGYRLTASCDTCPAYATAWLLADVDASQLGPIIKALTAGWAQIHSGHEQTVMALYERLMVGKYAEDGVR